MVDNAQDWKVSEEFQNEIQDQTLTDRRSLLGDPRHVTERCLFTSQTRLYEPRIFSLPFMHSGTNLPSPINSQIVSA